MNWTPENHEQSVKLGRRSAEFMSVIEPTDEQRKLLKGFGFEGADDNPWPALQVQKYDYSLRDKYEMADDDQQMEMDLGWLNLGGHLSVEKMDKLANAGKISKNWR